jgi:hypothetical protein
MITGSLAFVASPLSVFFTDKPANGEVMNHPVCKVFTCIMHVGEFMDRRRLILYGQVQDSSHFKN